MAVVRNCENLICFSFPPNSSCQTIVLAIIWLIIVRVITTLSICRKTLNAQETQFIDTKDPGVTPTSSVSMTRCFL